ncbi:hypothetical protein CLV62_11763 [Dysgonomonas alginatilytica]|uniref:Uncharacterized protein n=1 Tax=Dysgonomonas alginatilytica TaxID=1605892 RepID=A0A2V3PNS9_9BACT|nr:hypothetical protein [Dysgonomonas alginatilytica]PXV62847.1 hypothetical protein CLV62_11763 [Dysgonomonas alginatilytica]
MELLFKEIKQIITPEFIAESSRRFAMDETKLTNLSDSIVAGTLAGLLANGDNSASEEILISFVSRFNDIEEIKISPIEDQIDSKTIDAVIAWENKAFMGKRLEFVSLLAQTSGVGEVYVDKLMLSISYVAALYLGRKLMTKEYTTTGLLGQMHAERNFYLGYVPFGLTSLLGLPSLLALGQNLTSDAKVVSDTVYYEIMHANTPVQENKNSWRKWFFSKAAL